MNLTTIPRGHKPAPFEWRGTYLEAQDRLEFLSGEFAKIQTQLTMRKPTGPITREEQADYLDWRRRALAAQEHIRRERDGLRSWVRHHDARPANGTAQPESTTSTHAADLRRQIALKLDELGIDYGTDELENIRRRIAAELAIGRYQELLVDMVEMFEEHGCNQAPDCAGCALIGRVLEAV